MSLESIFDFLGSFYQVTVSSLAKKFLDSSHQISVDDAKVLLAEYLLGQKLPFHLALFAAYLDGNEVPNTGFCGTRLQNHPGENLCYVNAVVNSLLSCAKFHQTIRNSQGELESLFHDILDAAGVVHALTIKSVVARSNHLFANSSQQDSHEFLSALLDLLPSIKEKTLIGTNVQLECSRCCNSKELVDHMYDLKLVLRRNATLCTLLNSFGSKETVQLFCDICGHDTPQSRYESISIPPEILIVHALRYSSESLRTNMGPSIQVSVGGAGYKLTALIQHEGASIGGGHYVTRLPASRQQWIVCDDDR